MNVEKIKREIRSEALQEIVECLGTTINNYSAKKIEYQQAKIELGGCKHIIQSIALDWAFKGKASNIMDAVPAQISK